MKFEIEIQNQELIKELDRLVKVVPNSTAEACEKMSEVIRVPLIAAAPYDGSKAHKDKHLKEVIKTTKVKKNKDGKWVVIWVKPRGIAGAVQGKKAKKNWDKDKHIFKLVISEYGRSNMPAKPFWGLTVRRNADKAAQTGINFLKGKIEK